MGTHCARTAMWSAVSPSAFCAFTQRALHASAAEPSAAASSSRTAPAHWRSVAACSGVLPSASAANTSAPHAHSARTHAPFAAKCSALRPVLSRTLFTAARCAPSASSASSAATSPPIATPSSGDSNTGCRTSRRRCCCTSTPVAVGASRVPDIVSSPSVAHEGFWFFVFEKREKKEKRQKTARRLLKAAEKLEKGRRMEEISGKRTSDHLGLGVLGRTRRDVDDGVLGGHGGALGDSSRGLVRGRERGVDALDLGGRERLLHGADRHHLLQTKEQGVRLRVVLGAHNHLAQPLDRKRCSAKGEEKRRMIKLDVLF